MRPACHQQPAGRRCCSRQGSSRSSGWTPQASTGGTTAALCTGPCPNRAQPCRRPLSSCASAAAGPCSSQTARAGPCGPLAARAWALRPSAWLYSPASQCCRTAPARCCGRRPSRAMAAPSCQCGGSAAAQPAAAPGRSTDCLPAPAQMTSGPACAAPRAGSVPGATPCHGIAAPQGCWMAARARQSCRLGSSAAGCPCVAGTVCAGSAARLAPTA
jgi:hypothetical protein